MRQHAVSRRRPARRDACRRRNWRTIYQPGSIGCAPATQMAGAATRTNFLEARMAHIAAAVAASLPFHRRPERGSRLTRGRHAAVAAAAGLALGVPLTAAAWEPTKPVEFVVPAGT